MLALLALLAAGASAQIPPPSSGLTVVQSKFRPGVTISYKQTHNCETTPNVRSFGGYITFPSSTIPDLQGPTPFNISTYFWFFESRKDPQNAPTSIYLAGGPGSSSVGAAASEGGPCFVNRDSNSTTLNPWSLNNNVNMIYIDQPVQVGYSYDTLVDSTINILTGEILPIGPQNQPGPLLPAGRLPSQDLNSTTRTSASSARALWHFMQVFVKEFPEYKTTDKRISVWGNSYGGYTAPATGEFFQRQNELIKSGKLNDTNAIALPMDTVGITNGCPDLEVNALSYLQYAYNNTYDIQIINETQYNDGVAAFNGPGGCKDLIGQCRALGAEGDPLEYGRNETVNEFCGAAFFTCFTSLQEAYFATGRTPFDISRTALSGYPPPYLDGYFNQRWVQQDMGVSLNFTGVSASALNSTLLTGDAVRRNISSLNYIAQSGIKIAFVFGDRDYRCNWIGAETVSLAIEYPQAASFRAAGYQEIAVNGSYKGGVVRQHDRVTFARVFDAGHAVSAYQPETVFQIFNRVMFDKDAATGQFSTLGSISATSSNSTTSYSTTGSSSAWGFKNKLPAGEKNECYYWTAKDTCTPEEMLAIQNGTAIFKDYILVGIGNGTGKGGNGTSSSGAVSVNGLPFSKNTLICIIAALVAFMV